MSAVWTGSAQKGSTLLLLLAIADFANDEGTAWPGITTLAKKIRMTERSTQMIVAALVKSGELRVQRGAGPHGTNLYTVVYQRPLASQGGEKFSPEKIAGRNPGLEGVKPASPGGEIAASPEPSLTTKQPPGARKRALPDGFGISNTVREWARRKGWERYLDLHLEHFLGHAKANGSKYIDWDQAFQNCIRADWGGVRRQATGGRVDPVKAEPRCDYCSTSLANKGWTQAPKGRACDKCRHEYLHSGSYPTPTGARREQAGHAA